MGNDALPTNPAGSDHPAPTPRWTLRLIPEARQEAWLRLYREQHELHYYELGQVRERKARVRTALNKAGSALREAEAELKITQSAPVFDALREAEIQKWVFRKESEYRTLLPKFDGLVATHERLYGEVEALGRRMEKILPGSGEVDRDFMSGRKRTPEEQRQHENAMLRRYREHYRTAGKAQHSRKADRGAASGEPDIAPGM